MNIAQVRSIVSQFAGKLKNEKIPARKIILFGSYAKNRPHIDSDIDVAVILENETGIDREKLNEITWWAKQINVKLEPHILSENDFNNRWLSLPAEIKKTGVPINQ